MNYRREKIKTPVKATILALNVALLFFLKGWATELPTPTPSVSDAILRHVRFLASDEHMGRGVDTPGIERARDYIGEEFKKYGLVPGGERHSYFQGLEVPTGVSVREPSAVGFPSSSPLPGGAWIPLGLSASGTAQGEVVFAGYGITAKDYGYDDYARLDVKGKIVVVLRYEPPPKNDKSPFQKPPRYSNHATLRAKASNARDHGAIGMILVDLQSKPEGETELISLRRSLGRAESGFVAVQIDRRNVEAELQHRGLSLRELKERIDRDEKPASMPLGFAASLQVQLEKITHRTANVVGILPGAHPQLKEQAIVIGAHYDHIGLGYFGTRDTKTEGQIHYGADDNASGTALLLWLAEEFSRHSIRPPLSIVFVAFTAEELGLYGSRYFVDHRSPTLGPIRAMINLDMVGRMRDRKVTVSGVDTAKEFRAILEQAGKGLDLEMRPWVGRSDHVSFYNQSIPILHFYTGMHNDYHRPTDTWEKLNIDGTEKVGLLVFNAVERLALAKEPLTFVRVQAAPRRSVPALTSPPQTPNP